MPIDTDRLSSWPPIDERLVDRGQDALGDLDQHRRAFELLDQQHELVAAKPRADVAVPDARIEATRGFLQRLVAQLMAERVVEVLEPVEIHEQQRDRPAVAVGARERARSGSR